MKCASAANATVQYEVHTNGTCGDGDVLGGAFSPLALPQCKRAPHALCGTLIWGLEFLPTIGGMKAADGDVMTPW